MQNMIYLAETDTERACPIEGVTTPDCTRASCTGCCVCPTLGVGNVLWGERA